jgi:hypothetical protein
MGEGEERLVEKLGKGWRRVREGFEGEYATGMCDRMLISIRLG